jgi:hypothetical protein
MTYIVEQNCPSQNSRQLHLTLHKVIFAALHWADHGVLQLNHLIGDRGTGAAATKVLPTQWQAAAMHIMMPFKG